MNRKAAVMPIVCLCIFLLAACQKRTEVRDGDSFIYCLNSDRTGLVKVAFESKEEDTLKQVDQILEELKRPAEEIEYTTPLPKEVEMNGRKMEGEVLYLDFNGKYMDMPPVEEKLVRAAVVQSLVGIEGVSAVWVTVDGEDLKDSSGKTLGFQNEDDFVQNTGSSLSSYQTDTLTLYFANQAGDALVEQTMDVKYSSNMSKEKLIVEKLMKGPKKSGAYPTINSSVSLLSVTIKDGICYVNFDAGFLEGGVDVKPEITIYSIVNSIVEGTRANKVQITINGETNFYYMETVDLSQPLQWDMGLLEKTEDQ
ncbi:GerMN domain-containing protein [Luxibacter massiliensis]|uniref:GerMN domain-containing protein n=1 Tax=Luxibacter massiliensis TaxID=2219695 RepID=UPI00197E1C7A|nr:GerMN domain-containing protein [Luxibacter massiliensis]